MHIQTIIEQLYQLKLTAMAKELQQQQLKPGGSSLSFENRLGLLVSSEILFRENRRYLNLLRIAKLKQPAASIEDIDYRSNRNLNKSEFQNLTNLDFIKHHHNVLITGPTGSGKSYLACALGQASCRKSLSVRYLRLPRFIEELTIAHADGSYSRLLEQLLKTDLLILDDFGLTPLLQSQIHDLFNIIEDRHGVKSTLITGQLPIKHWHEYLGEPTIADAILDRLLQHSHIIELTGGSMRQVKNGLKNEPVDKPVHDTANSGDTDNATVTADIAVTVTDNIANKPKGDTNITGQVIVRIIMKNKEEPTKSLEKSLNHTRLAGKVR